MGYYIKGTSALSIFDPKDQLRRQSPFILYFIVCDDTGCYYNSMNNPAFLRAGRSAM